VALCSALPLRVPARTHQRDDPANALGAERHARCSCARLGEGDPGQRRQDAPRQAGEEVAPDYQLAEVFSDHVTLRHAGELMSRDDQTVGQGWRDLRWPATRGAGPHAKGKSPPELVERPQNFILADALLQPAPWVDASGNYAGMTLVGKTNASTLKQYGFKDEDVITAVNGRPIHQLAHRA